MRLKVSSCTLVCVALAISLPSFSAAIDHEKPKRSSKELRHALQNVKAKITEKRIDALQQVKKMVSEQQFTKLIGMNWGCRCAEPDSTKK